jgi:hypothetical protein
MWTNQVLTRGTVRANEKVPRGPITGCHVAPWVLPMWAMLKIVVARGIRTPDLRHCNALTPSASHCTFVCCLFYIRKLLYLNLNLYLIGGRRGRGLAPTPVICSAIRPCQKGPRPGKGPSAQYSYKVGIITKNWFFSYYLSLFNVINPFLRVIGHF